MEVEAKIGSKQIAINMIANVVSYSANILITFILTPFLIDKLGKEIYSFYPIANTIISYLSVLMNALNTMSSRFVTVAIAEKNRDDENRYMSSALAANIIMALILVVPMVILILVFDKFMDVPVNALSSIRVLFALVFSSVIVNVISAVFGVATFAKNRIDLRSLRELVTAVLKLALVFLFYYFFETSLIYIGIATLICAIVNVIIQRKYTKMLLPEVVISMSNVSKAYIKKLFCASAWNAINSFGCILLVGSVVIISNILYGVSESGIYSIVNTVPHFINGIILVLASVFYPVIMQRYVKGDKEALVNEVNRAQNFTGFFGCATIAVFSAFSESFFSLWTPGENAEYLSRLSIVVIVPHIVISCAWSLTNLNIAMNKIKIPALFLCGAGIVNVALDFIAKYVFGAGVDDIVLISTIIQIIWIGVFIPLYASYNLKIKPVRLFIPIIKGACCSVAVYLISVFFKSFIDIDSWFEFILFGGLFGACALVVFATVMIGPRKILAIVKNRLR